MRDLKKIGIALGLLVCLFMSNTKLAAQAPNTWTEKNGIGNNITHT